MTAFRTFRSNVNPFLPREMHRNTKLLCDTNGYPVGLQNPSGWADGLWVPIDLTAAEIAAPSALMIADLNSVFRLNVPPYTRYMSNGTTLVSLAGGTTGAPGPPGPAGPAGPPGPVGPSFGDGLFLPLTGGVINPGPLTIGNGTGAPSLVFNGAAGSGKGVFYRSAGTTRYQMTTAGDGSLGLYTFDAGGGYVGEGWYLDPVGKYLRTEFKLWSNVTVAAGPSEPSLGLLVSVHNTGTRSASAALIQYTSDSTGNFDTALNVNATFSNSVGGSFETLYFNCESPNTTTDSIWGGNVGEINFINRGPDSGFKRSRDLAGNNSGGLLFVPECVAPSGVGEGKNVGYGFSVAHSGGTNSTGFNARTYICFNAEPNATVGLTGRAFYASGDITNVPSQRPYGPFQTEGFWLHGFDHTLSTYMDNHAQIMKSDMGIAWIAGTTQTPTAVARIFGSMLGTEGNITVLTAGTTGKLILQTPHVFLGDGTGPSQLHISGAAGAENGIDWIEGGVKRWELACDAGNNLWLYKFDATGAFVGPQIGFDVTSGIFVSANIGFNGVAPLPRPTGWGPPTGTATRTTFATSSVTLPQVAEHLKALIDDLTRYGLIGT